MAHTPLHAEDPTAKPLETLAAEAGANEQDLPPNKRRVPLGQASLQLVDPHHGAHCMGLTGQEHLHATAVAKLAEAKRALTENAVEDVEGAMAILNKEVSTAFLIGLALLHQHCTLHSSVLCAAASRPGSHRLSVVLPNRK